MRMEPCSDHPEPLDFDGSGREVGRFDELWLDAGHRDRFLFAGLSAIGAQADKCAGGLICPTGGGHQACTEAMLRPQFRGAPLDLRDLDAVQAWARSRPLLR